MSSKSGKPNPDRGEKDKPEVVDGVLFKTRRDPAVAFDLAEEVFDEVPLFVSVAIERSLHFSVCFRGDDDVHPPFLDGFDNPIGVVAFVCNEVLSVGLFDEGFCFGDIVNVARTEVDVDGVTETVHECMDFGGKASARASNTLNLGPPFPPAAS